MIGSRSLVKRLIVKRVLNRVLINPHSKFNFATVSTSPRDVSNGVLSNENEKSDLPHLLQKVHLVTDRISSNVPIAVTSIAIAAAPVLVDVPESISQISLGSVYIGVGIPSVLHNFLGVYKNGGHTIKAFLDMHTMMSLSAFSALAIGKGVEGAFLLGLFQLAHAVEHHTVSRAAKDVNNLATLVPEKAQVVVAAESSSVGEVVVEETKCSDVSVGSVVLVRPHSVCPLDGILLSETASVNVAHITGESASVSKRTGGVIPAGAVNASSHAIQIKTTKSADQSTLQRIVALAQHAAHTRPRIASMFETYTPYYTASVLLGTAGIGASSVLVMGSPIGEALYTSLSFLVAASPCALLVASPVAQAAAVSACSRHGIVLSGGVAALERFATARTIALDKTGTITEGRMKVSEVHMMKEDPDKGHGEGFIFQLASTLARHGSRHPVSQAIAREAAARNRVKSQRSETNCGTGVPLKDNDFVLEVASVQELPGKGVTGVVKEAATGKEWEVDIGRYNSKRDGEMSGLSHLEGSITIIRASEVVDSASASPIEIQCAVSMADSVRQGVKESLRKSLLPAVMLTGDNRATALAIGKLIGMSPESIFSELTPEDKAEKVVSLENVLMVGDGINDAPALSAATAGGVAVASSSNGDSIQSAAVSVADAVILSSEKGATTNPIEAVNFLVKKSVQTQSIVRQNVGIALVSIVGTASMVVVHGCPLWMAVLFHEGSTVLVVLNGLRNLYP